MSEALRTLLAEFVIEVDKAGALVRGNAQIEALKDRLHELQSVAKVSAKSVSDVFSAAAANTNKWLMAQQAKGLTGGGGAGGWDAAGALKAKQVGPTRDTLDAGRAQMRAAEQAAAAYAQTLRGRLASAVDAVRAGFAGGGGGGKGPGLIASLATVRNGMLALGAGVAVRGVKGLVDSIGSIGEQASALGVTTDQFQRLNVLAKINNTSVAALGTAFRNLGNAAVQPTKESAAAFAKLGVSTKDASGQFKSTNDLFFEVGEALAGVTNETTRGALAQDLLGRSAQQLKPIFAQGTEAFRQQRIELLKLRVLSPEIIKGADDASDSWIILGTQLLAASEPLLKVLIPALKTLTEWVSKGVEVITKWLKNTDLASVAITALAWAFATKLLPGMRLMIGLGGGAVKTLLGMAGAGAKAALSFARMALPLIFIEDFLGFLNGSDSATGRLIEKIFGKAGVEVTLKAVNDLKAGLIDLWNWVTGAGTGEGIKRLWQEFGNGITVMINDLLHSVGIGKGGTNGPFKLMEEISTGPAGGRGSSGAPSYISPAMAAIAAAGAVPGAPPSISIGDTSVAITMSPSATAGDVGREVVSVVARERDALVAAYGGF